MDLTDLGWVKDPVVDHPYVGNLCGGFGGVVECEYPKADGRRCGRSPFEHVPAQHRRNDITVDPPYDGYEGRHRKEDGDGLT